MSERKDGGPAFSQDITDGRWAHGMSIRDVFVAAAPATEIADMTPQSIEGCAKLLGISEYHGEYHFVQVLAKLRGMWADAMLAERDKP